MSSLNKNFKRGLFNVLFLLVCAWPAFAQITVQTNVPPVIAPSSTLHIEVRINKGNTSNFAKYQMDFPPGVVCTEGNSFSGNFSFEEGRMKIVWVSLPAENEFLISFNLLSGSASGGAALNHKFYYLDNGVKKDYEPDPINVKFDPSGVAGTSPLPASGTTVTGTASQTTIAMEPQNPPVTRNEEKPKAEPPATGGPVYRLQLGALGADPGKAKFAPYGKVDIVHEGGFYKVLLGSYSSKEEALKKREDLLQKGMNSFVVAYLNGVRQK